MKLALVQTNPIIGAYKHNTKIVLSWIRKAQDAQCDMVIFPELTLCGYPPQDLLDRKSFIDAHDEALQEVLQNVSGITCILGSLERREGPGKPLFNSAYVIENHKIIHCARKQLLPSYDVFAETRYFEPGGVTTDFPSHDQCFGLTVCEDIWWRSETYAADPMASMPLGVIVPDFLINISASPYYHGKLAEREEIFRKKCRQYNIPLLYVNQVGGQDSLVFDGHSLVLNAKGEVVQAGKGFSEDMIVVDTDYCDHPSETLCVPKDSIEKVENALVLGVRDYLHKTGFTKAVIGLSGGIDSAVTAAIACRALGPEQVQCVAMPSPYTSQVSIDDAEQLARQLGCHFEILPIEEIMQSYHSLLAPVFEGLDEDVTEQNIQARIRGNLLMALSNKTGALLLSTGNKSEMAVGYCTLYGDMSGGLAVLADVPKVMVYNLARFYNRDKEVIPDRIITRPPTAELKPDQCDQDDLPPYETLDPILAAYLEEQKSVEGIVAQGFEKKVVLDIIRRVNRNEYKRKQAPLGIKVTTKAFGQGRRYPIVQNFQEDIA